jgi:D-aminopeptidase
VADANRTGRQSLRELGLRIGERPAGAANAITDVGAVAVGHVTVERDEPAPPGGRGIARTGVTAIAPRPPGTLLDAPVPAGAAVLNGAGEMTGFLQVSEWGLIETPVFLTATMAVGRVFDGAVSAAAAADPSVAERVVIPVVGECDDSWLSDPIPVQVEASDAGRALAAAAGGPVAQGAVGSGTGMVCFGWKGGIGTSSRVVDAPGGAGAGAGTVVGVLVMANFGSWPDLRIDGVPVGRALGRPEGPLRGAAGSCIAVAATDAPLNAAQLQRVARRAGLGLARTGSAAHHGSGEIFLAFSVTGTGGGAPGGGDQGAGAGGPAAVPDRDLDPIFEATVDASEEAVVNALWWAHDTRGREGRLVRALPHDDVLELLAAHGRLEGAAR